jgi:hypothetical protein
MKDWLQQANEENIKFNNSEYGKLSDGKIKQKEIGLQNVQSGLLSKIGKIGGIEMGKRNKANGHLQKLNSVSSKNRSERRKKKVDKNYVIEIMNKYPFNKDRAIALGITQVTLRRLLKDLKLYKKETGAEKILKIYSAKERSKLLNSHKNK